MYPIIAMWSHPRSMSTAIERIMRERGDLDCAHEPFMYDYYVNRRVREMPYFEVRPDHPIKYADIRDSLLERALRQPVFFKDMAYYVVPQLLADEEFCRRLTHTFLVRNPMASIVSYHKLDQALSDEEIGLESQWVLYQHLVQTFNLQPSILVAESVRTDPRGVIASFWRQTALPYLDQAFEWAAAAPEDWAQVGQWHQTASASSTIKPVDAQEVGNMRKKFAERAEHHPELRDLLIKHWPYYQRFVSRVSVVKPVDQ